MADEASLLRGRLPISGYEVSAVWLEPTVYPFLGFPRTPFLTVAEHLPLYRQYQEGPFQSGPSFTRRQIGYLATA